MEMVKIVLTCPVCGNSTWLEREETEDFMLECLACGEFANPEEMTAKTVVLKDKDN